MSEDELWVDLHLTADCCTLTRFDFDERTPVDLDHIMASMMTTGFQATNVALAINEINRMVKLLWRHAITTNITIAHSKSWNLY